VVAFYLRWLELSSGKIPPVRKSRQVAFSFSATARVTKVDTLLPYGHNFETMPESVTETTCPFGKPVSSIRTTNYASIWFWTTTQRTRPCDPSMVG